MKLPLASLKMHDMHLSPEKFVSHHGHAPTDETTLDEWWAVYPNLHDRLCIVRRFILLHRRAIDHLIGEAMIKVSVLCVEAIVKRFSHNRFHYALSLLRADKHDLDEICRHEQELIKWSEIIEDDVQLQSAISSVAYALACPEDHAITTSFVIRDAQCCAESAFDAGIDLSEAIVCLDQQLKDLRILT